MARRDSKNPAVRFEPGWRFGHAHMKGISTHAIADQIWVGEDPLDVCNDYGITHHELLVVLWYEATHGSYQAAWGKWADEHYQRLAGHRDLHTLPMPPDREGYR